VPSDATRAVPSDDAVCRKGQDKTPRALRPLGPLKTP
jgi:hypothetical protein